MSIRAIKYDPRTKEFSEVTINGLDDYYKHLECRIFDIVRLSEDIDVYVDDEGLFNSGSPVTELIGFGREIMLAGVLLFTGGGDDMGDTMSFKGSIEDIQKIVKETNLVVK